MAASLRRCANFLTTECQKLLQDLRFVASAFQTPRPDFDLAAVPVPQHASTAPCDHDGTAGSKSVLDSVFSNVLLAVQRDRRTVERRLTRKMQLPGHYEYAIPRNDIVACLECGHWHEKGTVCDRCYSKVREETKKMMEELGENMKYTADQKEVVFLYEGEGAGTSAHSGKHVVEMKKERPAWFPKNLMDKNDS